MSRLLFFALGVLAIACQSNDSNSGRVPFASASRQLVVVVSPNDTSTTAALRRFEARGKTWLPVGNVLPVTVGRNGLAWGRGLHQPEAGLQKREGDGKSPAGVFTFGQVFGYAPPAEARFKMPYVHASDALECVDDAASPFYNQLVDNRLQPKTWSSSEQMHRPDHQYRWGLTVNHNTPAQAAGGSCIFLHIWRAPGSPTSGCTAMSEPDLLELLHWLDPAQSPLLLQVTQADYPRFRMAFGLPE